MTGIQQIALQMAGGLLTVACVLLWQERKRRIRRAEWLKQWSDYTKSLLAVMKNDNALRGAGQAGAETYDLTTEVGCRAGLAKIESEGK